MKSFTICKLSMIVGLGAAALFLAPASKAQEVSPDHFTDTGVQGVYENTQTKVAAPKPAQVVQTKAHSRKDSPAVVQAAERTTISSKRKSVKTAPKKQ